jgi:hypothetical protein
MSPELNGALTAVAVAWFGLLLGLSGVGFVLTFFIRFLSGARGGLR